MRRVSSGELAEARKLQAARIIINGSNRETAAAEHCGSAVVPEPAFEGLHVNEAVGAPVGGRLIHCWDAWVRVLVNLISIQIRSGRVALS
jgi:hypothetical protein